MVGRGHGGVGGGFRRGCNRNPIYNLQSYLHVFLLKKISPEPAGQFQSNLNVQIKGQVLFNGEIITKLQT
jgi:hypothetical protein